VPFTQALQLIANRQVYLEGGFAYVPLQRVVSIITTRVSVGFTFEFFVCFANIPLLVSNSSFQSSS
jgi:hypothetical protein